MEFNTLHDIAVASIGIQDASNYRGVSLTFANAIKWLSDDAVKGDRDRQCDEEFRRDLTKMFTYKLMQLTFSREPIEYCDEWIESYRRVKVYLLTFAGFKDQKSFSEHYPRLQVVCDWEYMKNVLDFAKKRGILGDFMQRLQYLNDYAGDRSKGCQLSKDFAPFSFNIVMLDAKGGRWWNGGLIYYGKGDTGVEAPQLSVRIDSDLKEGWNINS